MTLKAVHKKSLYLSLKRSTLGTYTPRKHCHTAAYRNSAASLANNNGQLHLKIKLLFTYTNKKTNKKQETALEQICCGMCTVDQYKEAAGKDSYIRSHTA